jgi:UDP-3-O-[3-hydroxymyristoyl] glucosamine N-acyltransferase
VAQVGISGSTKLGRHVVLAGQVGLVGHIEIGDNARIGPQSGVMSSVPANSEIMGTLPMPAKLHFKVMALFKRLPELFDRVKKLEKIQEK